MQTDSEGKPGKIYRRGKSRDDVPLLCFLRVGPLGGIEIPITRQYVHAIAVYFDLQLAPAGFTVLPLAIIAEKIVGIGVGDGLLQTGAGVVATKTGLATGIVSEGPHSLVYGKVLKRPLSLRIEDA